MDALAVPKIHIAARESFHVFDICFGELLPYLIPRDVCSTHIDLLISFVPPEQKQIRDAGTDPLREFTEACREARLCSRIYSGDDTLEQLRQHEIGT